MREDHSPSVLSWLVIILATCFILFLFQKVLWLVVPSLAALLLYYCLRPLVSTFVRAGVRHRTAAKAVAALLALATVLALVLLLPYAAARADAWQNTVNHYLQGGLDFFGRTQEILVHHIPLLQKSASLQNSTTNLDAAAGRFTDKYLGDLLLQMVHWLPSLLLVPYLTYFLLQDGNRLKKHLINSVPNAFFERTLLLFDRVDQSLHNFISGIIKLTFLDTVCLALGLWALKISFPLLLGLIAAVLAWVPYLGSAVGCLLVVSVAATDYPNEPVTTYGCVLLFISVRLLDDFVFLPLTVGRSLRLHPVLSVVMLFLGAAVAGPTGLMLVLPVLGVVAVIVDSLAQIFSDQRLRRRFRHARQLGKKLPELA